ncbi:MAG: thiamine phosphate synthase [bacterium]
MWRRAVRVHYDTRLFRILDANLNRAAEGLRVIEDFLRFYKDAPAQAKKIRTLRHRIRDGIKKIPGGYGYLINARDAASDPCRTTSPQVKHDAQSMLVSNFRRSQEAIRVIEESLTSLSTEYSAYFAALRFELYQLEKDIITSTAGNLNKKSIPQAPFIYVIGSVGDFTSNRCKALMSLVEGGARVIQLREKNAADVELLSVAKRMASVAWKSGAVFILNDRVDLALMSGADGVHLGESDLPLSEVKKIAGGSLLIGVSTHSYQGALRAADEGPDYISAGPVFRSPTKPELTPIGLKALRRICAKVKIPVVAIGGINETNIVQVFEAGASGAAMISAIKNTADAERYLKKILRKVAGRTHQCAPKKRFNLNK